MSPCFFPFFSSFLCHSCSTLHSCPYILFPSLNPYCIIPYSPLYFLALSLSYLIFLSLFPWRENSNPPTPPFLPSLLLACCPISNPAFCLASLPFSLSGLFPQLEVNTLQDGIISFPALWQYKNSKWTAQSLFHLRFDCNGIASCPWEAPTASPTWSLWH